MNRVLAPGLGSTSGARADVVVGINIGTGKRPQVIADCCFLYSLATLTSLALRETLKKNLRDYLGIFPKRRPPPHPPPRPPLLGISTIFYRIFLVKLEIFG